MNNSDSMNELSKQYQHNLAQEGYIIEKYANGKTFDQIAAELNVPRSFAHLTVFKFEKTLVDLQRSLEGFYFPNLIFKRQFKVG